MDAGRGARDVLASESRVPSPESRVPRPESHDPRPMTQKTILLFTAPVYEDLELWYPKIRLEEEGARTVVAGLGEPEYKGKHGYPVKVDTAVDGLRAADFDGLVIPGGFAPDKMRRNAKLLELTREIFNARKPVGFIRCKRCFG